MKNNLAISHCDMVDSTRRTAHSAAYFCSLKSRTGSRRTGNPAVFVTEDHFTVCTDINHERQLFKFIKMYGRHASYRISAYESGNIRKNAKLSVRMDRKKRCRRNFHCFGYIWHVGRNRQGSRINSEKKMLHFSISHDTGKCDIRRCNACFF